MNCEWCTSTCNRIAWRDGRDDSYQAIETLTIDREGLRERIVHASNIARVGSGAGAAQVVGTVAYARCDRSYMGL